MSLGAAAAWGVIAAMFLVIEVVTVGLVSIWFTVGAVVSLIAAILGAPVWLQVVLFLVVSGLCFALLYPKMKHLILKNRHATNADMALGQTCVVTRRIDNVAGTGAVTVAGKTWTARSSDGETIEEGALVRADAIEGVKLLVTPVHETVNN